MKYRMRQRTPQFYQAGLESARRGLKKTSKINRLWKRNAFSFSINMTLL
ncbi:hypothetical protein A33K_12770 [Burkholderia humptydooensis MSMB43]|uniref:Transposase n=1 Tax=Burkholderia humptydooensis MSMB43 TaxID=441157 RepID=A0ABN0GAL2_9BURK|nr:hypothetical protein A33K_12770 [Burkholderia humptydooensis MSMB43]